jgi:hypothetical protein
MGAVLLQLSDNGNVNIVSTASRVLTAAEQRYTTCELELLAIVYALSKFRIYIYGSKVILNTDNRALTFLDRCAITSNRVARWSLDNQSYDLVINHVKGVDNYLADVLSRNPAGLTASEIRRLNKPATVMVNKIELNIDKEVCKELKNLAALQKIDPKLLKFRAELVSQNRTQRARYKLQNDVLYCKGAGPKATWKPVLPSALEGKVFRYVHHSLGHAGVDKCGPQVSDTYQVKGLGRKLRQYISCCDTCQRVKHPNRAYVTEQRSHMPTNPGSLCAIDLFGSLPTSRGGVRYILVCLDVFSKYIKLYPLKSATTRACRKSSHLQRKARK